MNGLQTLYLESIFGIRIDSLTYGANEFEGQITMDDIRTICETSGCCFWQNPGAPVGEIAYLVVPTDAETLNVSIDPFTHTIVVVEASHG